MPERISSEQRYESLYRCLSSAIPQSRLIRTPLRTFAYGTDASFYRLVPKLVVQVQSEAEVIKTIRACVEHNVPYTYRAAGTSLSGQALSDSVLIQVSRLWDGVEISSDGLHVRCQPAALGGRINRALAGFRRKIGPDPASIDSAMIGGIVANNASGMCCGNIQDTYHTMDSIRVVFSDGSVLDTASSASRQKFSIERCDLVDKIDDLAKRVKSNAALVKRIRHKYRIKNTTGYSIHALIDFDHPLDIIAHLMVGSEGTLGFISEITYRSVPDPPCHGTALILFPDIRAACKASSELGRIQVAAVEIMDRYSLSSIKDKPGVPDFLRSLENDTTALLIEVAGNNEQERRTVVAEVNSLLAQHPLVSPAQFTFDEMESKRLWEVRKGLFPSLGQARSPGTTIIIEDVAFPPETLAEGARDLRRLFQQYGYKDAVIFGHALQGNLHFVFCVDFNRPADVKNYARFMEAMTRVVTEKYDGSLKAEHGTGRNVSPFVEREWGTEASAIMREIKKIFDPEGLLNPGVIISDNPQNHISNLKRTPVSDPIIEKCTECGFCERTCPSRLLSLTPRQRIAAWREMSGLEMSGLDRQRLRQFKQEFDYEGQASCAADGLCGTLCPVGIDTGAFIKELRGAQHSHWRRLLADCTARHFSEVVWTARGLLAAGHLAQRYIGAGRLTALTRFGRKFLGRQLPEWNTWVPRPARGLRHMRQNAVGEPVVYFPACVSRIFGVSNCEQNISHADIVETLFAKAGFRAIYPRNVNQLCCGMAFASKGFFAAAQKKMDQLIAELASLAGGVYPVVVDTSPCAARLRSAARNANLRIYEISEFLLHEVAPRVHIQKTPGPVGVHVPCSLRVNGGHQNLLQLAGLCAENVHIAESAPCCGFAGDRGFSYPELPASALVRFASDLPHGCVEGYSSSRTCEIGISMHTGIHFRSVAYLLDKVSTGRSRQGATRP